MKRRNRPSSKKGEATWDADAKLGTLVRTKGKYMDKMGFAGCLFAEEVVFLLDRDELVVKASDGSETTAEDAFAMLDAADVDVDAYQVFSVLREQRFNVFRAGYSSARSRTEKARLAPPTVSSSSTELTPSYDVYLPSSAFAKSKLGAPHFSVCVVNADDPLPTIRSMRASAKKSPHPIRLAIVGDSSVSFVEYTDFDPSSVRAAVGTDMKPKQKNKRRPPRDKVNAAVDKKQKIET